MKRRHLWNEIGSGSARCRRCELYRVEKRKPGGVFTRVTVVVYERRSVAGDVIETLSAPGPCPDSSEQEEIFDLSRFE